MENTDVGPILMNMQSNLIEMTSAWVFSSTFAAYFQNTFFYEHLWTAASELCFLGYILENFI